MGYSYMTIRKYHDFTSLARAYAHNYRLADVPNAAPGLRGENQELVKCEDKNGNAVTYAESVRERVKNLTYYETHRLRRNAVLAMDVLVSFSREDIGKVDLEKWKQENVRWLQETFNRDSARNGENVISVVFWR